MLTLPLRLIAVVRFDVTQLRGLFVVLRADRQILFLGDRSDLFLDRLEIGRCPLRLHTHAGSRLIHQVDRLIGQEAVVDIAAGERLVRDGEVMMRLVLVAQPLEDLKRLLARRLADLHRLEAALQRGVLLDIFSVLGKRRGADDTDLAAPERGLDDICRIHRTLGAARADDGMQLINEENDAAVAFDLVNESLDALFKLAAVLRTGDHARKVKRQKTLVHQLLRHIGKHDLLGKSFGDGRLAHARLADEHGVVLRAAREDLDGAVDLLIAPDHGIQLSLTRHRGQIAGKLRETLAAFRLRAADASGFGRGGARRFPASLHNGSVKLFDIHAGSRQQAYRHVASVPQQPQKQVLRLDHLASGARRLADGKLHRAARAGGQPLRRHGFRHAASDRTNDQIAHHRLRETGLDQRPIGVAAVLTQKRQQQVLAADVAVSQLACRLLRKTQNILRTRRELLFTHILSLLS